MNPVIANFTTVDQQFPAGTVASYLLTLTLQGDSMPTDSPTPSPTTVTGTGQIGDTSITVDNVPQGTYSGSIALVDTSGEPLADPVVDPALLVVIDVVETVTLPVPTSLSLTRP